MIPGKHRAKKRTSDGYARLAQAVILQAAIDALAVSDGKVPSTLPVPGRSRRNGTIAEWQQKARAALEAELRHFLFSDETEGWRKFWAIVAFGDEDGEYWFERIAGLLGGQCARESH